MIRRMFLKKSAFTACGSALVPQLIGAAEKEESPKSSTKSELDSHRIMKIDRLVAKYHFPRLVGRNSRRDINGQHKSVSCVRLTTDKGAVGWGNLRGKLSQALISNIQGKTVHELFTEEQGIRQDSLYPVDFALHDLAGVILNKPVYKMLGARGPKITDVYSGMIYFDELDKDAKPGSLDRVLANCQWDFDYGYRQLKVKIGRGSKWYPKAQGLKTDIKIVRMIHESFGKKGVQILVDANDGYSLEDTIAFLKGVEGVPIYWVEEPFRENLKESRKLKKWMVNNGWDKTYYSDGEHRPDYQVIDQLIQEGTLDMHLVDIASYGFTKWRKLIPHLAAKKAVASPHTWGSMLKTHYVSHLSAGLGSIPTVEGVTCLSDDIDFGDYKIVDGKLQVSESPGFGMKLLI